MLYAIPTLFIFYENACQRWETDPLPTTTTTFTTTGFPFSKEKCPMMGVPRVLTILETVSLLWYFSLSFSSWTQTRIVLRISFGGLMSGCHWMMTSKLMHNHVHSTLIAMIVFGFKGNLAGVTKVFNVKSRLNSPFSIEDFSQVIFLDSATKQFNHYCIFGQMCRSLVKLNLPMSFVPKNSRFKVS